MGKTDLLSLLPEEAQGFLVENGEQKYREKQIFSWLMKGKSFENMQNLPIKTREMLAEQCLPPLPTVEAKQISKIDGTVKYLFRLHDGNMVESVLMKYEYGNSLCISSQVGCRMGCRFCASTLSGKARDLLPSELLGQIIVAQSDSGCHVSHVVLMGIGEPLDNYDNVVKFLRLAAHPERLGLSPRRVSLSTCGVVPGIYALAKEDLPVTLSVSLHASNDDKRSDIMPINRKYPLRELLAACKAYFDATGRRISFEYTLLADVNDHKADVEELGRLLRQHLGNMPIHVNLIRLNEVKEREFKSTATARAKQFITYLEQFRITATLRRRLGSDVDAACGQLRSKTIARTPEN